MTRFMSLQAKRSNLVEIAVFYLMKLPRFARNETLETFFSLYSSHFEKEPNFSAELSCFKDYQEDKVQEMGNVEC